jgi:hypothetical protein
MANFYDKDGDYIMDLGQNPTADDDSDQEEEEE